MIEKTLEKVSRENHGIVTTADVVAAGFSESALRQHARRHPDEVEKLGSGIYLFLDPEEKTGVESSDSTFLVALGLAGSQAYLTGSTVLDYYNLANANPEKITVRTPHRFRRVFPNWMKVSHTTRRERVDVINGIRLQNLEAAFLDAKDTRVDYRLEGLNDAESRNLIGGDAADRVREKLRRKQGR
ncbi:MAG: hypothetical protein LKI93_05625 [Bifidobacteriaceae bacterium]|jgi:predicted transcriptional regulator of viral defense system|nr:hypothetical protein [Bifidobacteriaceae bacterium]MCI1914879.1 hypothetical protein [Bifidobacteriaceae bacterium]